MIGLNKEELLKLFRPETTCIIKGLKTAKTIQALDELIQLTPKGLFEMMRIKLNKGFAPFKVLKSIECDIHVSGDLDYKNEF